MLEIRRKMLDQVRAHLSRKEISLIVGARQTGKTSLMLSLQEELGKKGDRSLFLSLDFEEDRRHFASQPALLRKLDLEFGKKKACVFIDEIQRLQNAGLFLKGLYDRNLPYKLIVSGSGSLELKEKIHESLTGRKRLFELMPVSLSEYVSFATNYAQPNLPGFHAAEPERALNLLNDYLSFGGYPRVILEKTIAEKRKIIQEIFQSYLEKDIAFLLRVEKVDAFSEMIRVLADQTSGLLNHADLSSTLGLSFPTLKNYLWYAEKTFVIHLLRPYYRDKRKEISKSPAVYFFDLGLRNYALGYFGNADISSDMGLRFQNLIWQILKERVSESGEVLRYWRTKDRAEVDFVLSIGKKLLPIEVKYSRMIRPEIGASLRNFIARYSPKEAWVINLSLSSEAAINGCSVKFLRYFDLL